MSGVGFSVFLGLLGVLWLFWGVTPIFVSFT